MNVTLTSRTESKSRFDASGDGIPTAGDLSKLLSERDGSEGNDWSEPFGLGGGFVLFF